MLLWSDSQINHQRWSSLDMSSIGVSHFFNTVDSIIEVIIIAINIIIIYIWKASSLTATWYQLKWWSVKSLLESWSILFAAAGGWGLLHHLGGRLNEPTDPYFSTPNFQSCCLKWRPFFLLSLKHVWSHDVIGFIDDNDSDNDSNEDDTDDRRLWLWNTWSAKQRDWSQPAPAQPGA